MCNLCIVKITMALFKHLFSFKTIGAVFVLAVFGIVRLEVVGFNVDIENALVFSGKKNTYFGYSVAILANSEGTWLLAGAPRAKANDSSLPDVNETGAVFRCNWQYRSRCEPVHIDSIANEKASNQWLGSSIDVNVNGDLSVMICAPRWLNRKYFVQGVQFMNGICYESNRDFNSTSIRQALEDAKKQVHASGAYHVYGMGSLGMSTVYSKDGSFSVLGAPGINDWAGGYAQIEKQNPKKPQVREMAFNTDKDSYFGMAVTTAKLVTEELFIVIGGPRAGGSGKIYAYTTDFKLVLVKEGNQLGSSFGSSLCAADVNGDNLDDLIIGAPLFSDSHDEGRVYVFLNREFLNLELDENLLAGSNAVGARFGTAVANLGDLNLDRFEDIAVGAPYEEDSGVVYIYNGGSDGLRPAPSQRIVGKAIVNDLKTFGWSFSRPWDVDNNHYGDFAVGAFESSKVILFRTRSVVDLNVTLELSPIMTDLNSSTNCAFRGQRFRCIEFTVCLLYTGKNLPPSSDVNVTFMLDTLERHRGERSRMFMEGLGLQEIETFNDIITIRLDKKICPRKYKIFLRESRDVFTPMRIDVEYDIASSSIGIASWCTICPIKNIYNPRNTFIMAYYSLDCKEGHSCQPEFNITTHPVFKKGEQTLVIDNAPYFDLEVALKNVGEISYLTTVEIDYPLYLHYTITRVVEGEPTVTCFSSSSVSNSSQNSINCDILKAIRQGDRVILSSRFYAQSIPYNLNSVSINIRVLTVNRRVGETKVQKYNVSIPVQISSEMKLTGAPVPGQLQITRMHHSVEGWETLSHIYSLSNLGPSPLPHSQLIFQVPTNDWLKLADVKVEIKTSYSALQVPVECNMVEQTNETNVTFLLDDESSLPFLKCGSSACTKVTCYVGYMYTYQSIYINLSLSLNRDSLHLAKVDDKFGLVTSCLLQEPKYISYTSLSTVINVTTVTYIGYKSTLSQAVSWWAIIISVASGILLLYILVVLLWKCGFFKRKQREELQKFIQYIEFEREIHSDSGSARSNDLMILPPGLIPVNSNHNCLHFPESPVFPPFGDDQPSPLNYSDDYFFSSTLNRRQISTADLPPVSFHTLQYHNNNNMPLLPRPRNHHRRRDGSRNSHRKLAPNHSPGQRQNVWLASPALLPPPPPPSFNNDLYLEPLDSRA